MYRIQYRIPDNETVRTLRLVGGAATIVTAALLVFGTGLLRSATRSVTGDQVAAAPPAPAQQADGHPFLDTFNSDFAGTYTKSTDAVSSHLTLDGAATGDLPAKVHIELVQLGDNDKDGDVSSDTDNDGDSRVSQNLVRVTDPTTGAMLCSGQLTALQGNYLQFTCDGSGPYAGVQMTVATNVRASRDGSFSGPLNGTMSRG